MPDKTSEKLSRLDHQIRQLQRALARLGPMRPGTLSRQYRDPRRRRGAYSQLSYTYRMKSRTEYVRPDDLARVRSEITTFKRFKRLTARWIALALQRSRLQRTPVRSSSARGES